jgi:hypothetical protein
MQIRPELDALRRDDAPQRQAQARLVEDLARWRAGPAAPLDTELARFGDGAELDDLPLLSALFAPGETAAEDFAAELVARFVAALERDPLGQVPLRHYTDDLVTTLMLARNARSTLTLQALDGTGLARRAAPVSAGFPPSEAIERVLAGSAHGEVVSIVAARPGGADLSSAELHLRAGDVHRRDGSREALILRSVAGSLVTLKLQRRTASNAVTHEYRLADGALVHQAAGNPRDSRLELTAALLGRMGRTDAAPLLAAMAEETGSPALRWQALRECLALDSAAGFAALSQLARRGEDPLCGPAGALRAQLIETYPQLAGVASCPA